MRCPEAPIFKYGTEVFASTEWDPQSDEPIYQAIAQYTCPEGHVFEIYQEPVPDPDINFGLIEDETSVLNVTCAAHAQWDPNPVPPCIRKLHEKASI